MNTLTQRAFDRAGAFIRRHGRPLERALFAFRFEAGVAAGTTGADIADATAAVLDALAAYRNDDGGFGRALEPDVRTDASSAYLTGLALETLREVGAAADDPLPADAIAHLGATLDRAQRVWPVLPPEAQDAPRAPWWNDEDEPPFGRLVDSFDGFRIVPRSRIVDVLLSFDAHRVIPGFSEVVDDTLAAIADASAEELGGGNAFADAVVLVSNERLGDDRVRSAKANLRQRLPEVIWLDPTTWHAYGSTPIRVFPHPSSLADAPSTAALQEQLDRVVDQQEDDGSWLPTWTWMGAYPDVWKLARAEWLGVVTLETLTTLRSYGRISAH